MLVKIMNGTKEFKEKMEVLKRKLGLKVTSKVAEYCVENYNDLDVRNTKANAEIERLNNIIDGIKDNLCAKEDAENCINYLLKSHN